MIGVKPGRLGVTFMSANGFLLVGCCSFRSDHARSARRQPPYARLDLCGPPGGGDGVARRGDYACKSRELCARKASPDRCQTVSGLWPIAVEREQLMVAIRLDDPLTADQRTPKCGIYLIENVTSGRVYVGSSINITRRWDGHRSLLQNGNHHSLRLQRSWSKHGAAAFVFKVIELVNLDKLVEREQHWLTELSAADPKRGFNVLPNAGTPKGRTFSPETKAKMSAGQRGRKFSAEHRAKIGLKSLGRKHTEKAKRSIGMFHKGKVLSPETLAKWKKSYNGLVDHSPEAQQRRSAAMMGHVVTQETREKIRVGLLGVTKAPLTATHRAKIGAAIKATLAAKREALCV